MTLDELVQRPAIELAPRLIGWRLVRLEDGDRTTVEIHETEAYPGGADRASHSFDGRRTARNESMWAEGGHLYVFLVYGMHHCLNIVSGRSGEGEAVLLRAGQPLEGLERMAQRRPAARRERELCSGPGRLAQALGIDRSWDGLDLRTGSELRLEPPPDSGKNPIRRGPRVGVEYAGSWARRRLRFGLDRSYWLSQPPIEGPLVRFKDGLAQENARSR